MEKINAILLSLLSLFTSLISRIPGLPAQSNIAQELRECLPKSDQASKETCERLLNAISNFDECVRAGFPQMESDPPRCALPNGKSFTRQSSPSSGGETAVLLGTMVCLPHKDTISPKASECLVGIKGENGLHYALDTSMLQSDIIISVKTNDKIEVRGTLVPIEAISSDQWQKYDIKGIMRVNSMKKL